MLGSDRSIHEWTIGLAFAGSFVTSYTVREILLELLPRAQVVSEQISPSLAFVVSVVAKVFEDVTRQVGRSLFEEGTAELLVGGRCPVAKELQLFHIKAEVSEELVFTTAKEDLRKPVFIGSGARRARELMTEDNGRDLLVLLRQVIRDENVPSVGGPIQIGEFRDREFRILGIQDYDVEDGVITVKHLYRGVRVRKLVEDIGVPYAHFATSYLAPFYPEIRHVAETGKVVRDED
jgi:hypothetical protein